MEQDKYIGAMTLMLAAVGGFCDTATFISANEIFSAHVTGNFILFAFDIIRHARGEVWIKLLTFPVFILAVMAGGLLSRRFTNKCHLIVFEGVVLVITGVAALCCQSFHLLPGEHIPLYYLLALGVVFAMGLQNAFGKLYAKALHGPTTMMTGNVTQAALDLGLAIKSLFRDPAIIKSLGKQSQAISGFLMGCLLGAAAGQYFGLMSVILPGAILLLCYMATYESRETEGKV